MVVRVKEYADWLRTTKFAYSAEELEDSWGSDSDYTTVNLACAVESLIQTFETSEGVKEFNDLHNKKWGDTHK